MSLTFRICNEEDIALAEPAFSAAYGFQENQVAMLHRYWELQPDGWWLAILDENPVGFGGAVNYGAFSYAGMIGVHPRVQRRGIGEALVRQILAWGERIGCPTMLLNAADRAASLYRRLGFVEDATVPHLVRSGHVPLPTLSAGVDLLHASDIPELVSFDQPFFGAEREKIFRLYLKMYPDRAFVTRNSDGHLTGYLFAQKTFLGPWIASTREDAERLLIQALSLSYTRAPVASIPAVNSSGLELLKRYRFQEQNHDHSMRLGEPVNSRQLAMIYGEASPALG